MVGLQLSRSSTIKEAENAVLGLVSSGEIGVEKAGSCRNNNEKWQKVEKLFAKSPIG